MLLPKTTPGMCFSLSRGNSAIPGVGISLDWWQQICLKKDLVDRNPKSWANFPPTPQDDGGKVSLMGANFPPTPRQDGGKVSLSIGANFPPTPQDGGKFSLMGANFPPIFFPEFVYFVLEFVYFFLEFVYFLTELVYFLPELVYFLPELVYFFPGENQSNWSRLFFTRSCTRLLLHYILVIKIYFVLRVVVVYYS